MDRPNSTRPAASVDIDLPFVHYETAIEQATRIVRDAAVRVARKRRPFGLLRRPYDRAQPKRSIAQFERVVEVLLDYLADEERRAALDCAEGMGSTAAELALASAACDGRLDATRSPLTRRGSLDAAHASRAEWRAAYDRAAVDGYVNDASFAAKHVAMFDRLIARIESSLAAHPELDDEEAALTKARDRRGSVQAQATVFLPLGSDCKCEHDA